MASDGRSPNQKFEKRPETSLKNFKPCSIASKLFTCTFSQFSTHDFKPNCRHNVNFFNENLHVLTIGDCDVWCSYKDELFDQVTIRWRSVSARLPAATAGNPSCAFPCSDVCLRVRAPCLRLCMVLCDSPVLSASCPCFCLLSEGAKWQNNSLGSKLSL